MANTLNGVASSGQTSNGGAPNPAAASPRSDVSKDLFLKLMVAQLKNQNPLNPVDGVDFLMQLSQISGVEQMVEVKQQLTAIRSILEGQSGAAATKTE